MDTIQKMKDMQALKKGKEKMKRIIYGRTIIIFALLALQVFVFLISSVILREYNIYIYGFLTIIKGIILIEVFNNKENPSFKLSWVLPILLLPVVGVLLYLFVKMQRGTKVLNRRFRYLESETEQYLKQNKMVEGALKKEAPRVCSLANYAYNRGGYPIYKNTFVSYFPSGEEKFKELLRQLEKAEKFIFLEYFIVSDGYVWDSVLEILKRKAKEGVEVRFMYDGMCTFTSLPYFYPKYLATFGIKCKVFSQIRPVLDTVQNNRDHRKIVVIDGKVAFTGGVNLADEYINKIKRFGYWKDAAVMLEGDAVLSFTSMFLQMWNVKSERQERYEKYLIKNNKKKTLITDGYVLPYGDNPFKQENLGRAIYLDILYTAEKYVHIMTPYLIIDNEMLEALTFAAKRGVDVALILPHIPDKKYAFYLAKSYYRVLVEAGVKLYEFIPGFVHSKVFVSDDMKATVGSVNLDYRSLFLHFECGTYMYRSKVISNIEDDFERTLDKCQRITMEVIKRQKFFQWLLGKILRFVAPLM